MYNKIEGKKQQQPNTTQHNTMNETDFISLIVPDNKFKMVDVQTAFIEHFIRGIVTEKGYKMMEEQKRFEL